MIQLLVNGVEKPCPVNNETNLQELLAYVRDSLSSDSSMITLIRIDGIDLSEDDEREYSEVPLSALESVEVFTSHPREVAQETLQLLVAYTSHLEAYSLRAAEALTAQKGQAEEFARLVEGVSTFIDSLFNSKRVLRLGTLKNESVDSLIALLEVDLVEILKELTEYFQKGEWEHVTALLREHLPSNLQEWREKGLPALIRARDS